MALIALWLAMSPLSPDANAQPVADEEGDARATGAFPALRLAGPADSDAASSHNIREGSTATLILDGSAGSAEPPSAPQADGPPRGYVVVVAVQHLTTDFSDLGRAYAARRESTGRAENLLYVDYDRRDPAVGTDYYRVYVADRSRPGAFRIPVLDDGTGEGDEWFRVFIAAMLGTPGASGIDDSLMNAPALDFTVPANSGFSSARTAAAEAIQTSRQASREEASAQAAQTYREAVAAREAQAAAARAAQEEAANQPPSATADVPAQNSAGRANGRSAPAPTAAREAQAARAAQAREAQAAWEAQAAANQPPSAVADQRLGAAVTEPESNWLLTLAGLAALLLAYPATRFAMSLRTRARVRRRVSGFSHLAASDDEAAQVQPEGATMRTQSRTSFLDARYPLAGGVRAATFGISFGLATTTLLTAALIFFGVPWPIAILAALVAGASVGMNVADTLENRRRREFEDRFKIVIENFQRMVHFGISPPRAFESVTDAADEPVKSILGNVVNAMQLGVPLAQALDVEARRVRIGELAMLAAILGTQADTGGDLSEAISNLAGMLRERLDMRTQLSATTAESRLTLIILAVVPLIAMAIQSTVQPNWFQTMIGEARHLLGIGVGLIVGGLLVARALMRSVTP